jgi:phosphoserine phosphatase
VGDNLNDLGLLRLADRAFAIEPKSPTLAKDAAAHGHRASTNCWPADAAPAAAGGTAERGPSP